MTFKPSATSISLLLVSLLWLPVIMSAGCDLDSFPFEFFGEDGQVVNGTSVGEDGVCVFPEAKCGLDSSIDDCCRAKSGEAETGGGYMFIAFIFIFIPYLYLTRLSRGDDSSDGSGNEEENKDTNDQDKNEETKNEESDGDPTKNPAWVNQIPILRNVFQYGLWVSITLQIMIPIFMRSSLQAKLDVASRNALIAGEAFIVPYSEIFQFIEDIVLVRVNYAMARGYKEQTDKLVHAGIAGSLFTGILAAGIGSLLGAIPPVLSVITNPGLENDKSLYPGCDLIADDNSNILPYWLMEVWALPGRQVGMVLSGFLMGAMELATLGWMITISLALTPLIWFTAVDSAPNRLLLLSTAEFATHWCLPLLVICYMICPLGFDLRESTGVRLSLTKISSSFSALKGSSSQQNRNQHQRTLDNSDPAATYGTVEQKDKTVVDEEQENDGKELESTQQEEEEEESTGALLMEGLKIMAMDVAIQMCISISVYLALANNAADGYKLTALQSLLPSYGVAYAFGMGMMFKIAGPQLLAHGATKIFAVLARLTMISAYLLVPLILSSVLPFREGMAVDSGGNACAYAHSEECVPFFNHVFGEDAAGGDFTLAFTFSFFPLGACAEALLFVLRSTLLTLVDLSFMLKSTLVAVLVYIPCIIVATTVEPFANHASAYFVAMYIPQVVLIVLFTFRLEVLVRRILRGEDGAWSDEKKSSESPEGPSADSARQGVSRRSVQRRSIAGAPSTRHLNC